MARGTLLYFVSDLHGSSMCFRKFVNATGVYKLTVLVLGGDVAGKAAAWPSPTCSWRPIPAIARPTSSWSR
jgi:hypothetical protein